MNKKPFLYRLGFIDKCIFDKAYSELKYSPELTSDEENAFILSLLDDKDTYEISSVLDAMNFVNSAMDEHKYPSCKIIERLFYLSFIEPTFIPKFVSTVHRLHDSALMYRALLYIVGGNFNLLEKSIKNDWPIWTFIFDELEKNSMSADYDPSDDIANRKESTIVEVFVNYWPHEKTIGVQLKELMKEFCNFCLATNTKTSLRLLSILVYTFPIESFPHVKEELYKLPSDVIRRIKETKLKAFLKKKERLASGKKKQPSMEFNDEVVLEYSDEIEDKGLFAIRQLFFNIEEAKEIASETSDDIRELCEHYDPATHMFVL